MKRTRNLGLAALALAALPASAQTAKIGGDIQLWYTQMTDSNLRRNSAAPGGYYNLRSEFKENTFTIRRTEIKVSGNVAEGVDYEVMFDPSISTGTSNPNILQDAFIVWKPIAGFDVKAGQFKNLQTLEGVTSSTELLFAERSQLGRMFGDKRDRGLALGFSYGDPKGFAGKVTAAVFNGMNDAVAGKANDTNAQKDFVLRLDFSLGKVHKFGAYTLQGTTDVADKGNPPASIAANPGGVWPSQAAIYDNKDKTTNLGAFYAYQDGTWTFTAEYMTGLLGRRFATLAASAPAVKREHLDQKFQSYYVTGGYTFGHHSFLARYDMMNLNSGDDWYTATNPYTTNVATGLPTGTDFEPKYTEVTVGYTYAWIPEKVKAANFKVNYIARSKNFLKPLGTETGEQGGNTVVAALLVAF
ncbi:porin [Geothrix fermentans]|uniref:porin n=1 Tax=Geothrix fermentans TaxID=44676 RepID=UPI0003FAFF22|nr:porin [Geothrix fermentans]